LKILLKPVFIISIIAVIFVTGIVLSINVSAEENLIPSWVKNNAGWWADDTIDDNSFIQGIQFLIDTGVVIVPEIDNLKMEKTKMLQDTAQDKRTIVELTRENTFLKNYNNELLVQLDEGRIIIEELVLVIEENITEKTITSAPESTGLSGQSVPDTLWGYVDAEYYDNRYERLNVKIHTSDKFENDFIFEAGQVDVVVSYEAQHGKSIHGVNHNRAYSHSGDEDVVVIRSTLKFSESDYSYDNKLVFDIEGCLAEDIYLVEATIWSDMGNGFTFDDKFSVDSGTCGG
jgi:hypothetical protein